MRRFLITSHAWKGHAELVFATDGTLCKIDLSNTDMPTAIVRIFKEKAPAHFTELQAAFKGTNAVVIEAEFEATFEMFWLAYNKKINKLRCEKLWAKLDKVKQVKAIFGVKPYDKYLHQTGYRNKADPETYLRNETWENEWK